MASFVLMLGVLIFFFLRELNYRFSKINERIAQMEEQNNLLWTLILGATPNDVIKKEVSLEHKAEQPIEEKRNGGKPKIAKNGVNGFTNYIFRNMNL